MNALQLLAWRLTGIALVGVPVSLVIGSLLAPSDDLAEGLIGIGAGVLGIFVGELFAMIAEEYRTRRRMAKGEPRL